MLAIATTANAAITHSVTSSATAGLAGYTTWDVSFTTDTDLISGFNIVVTADTGSALNQVNPAGIATIFEDANVFFAFVNMDVSADTQFHYASSTLTIASSSESATDLSGAFTWSGGTNDARMAATVNVLQICMADGNHAVLSGSISVASQGGIPIDMAFPDIPIPLPEPITLSLLMDIRPGSDSNPVNSKSNGALPVAIYGTDDIDVTEIDLETLMLEGMSLREKGKSGKLGTFEDINGDSIVDLLLHFEMSELSFNASSDEYTLSGMMLDGMALEGSDSIRSVPHGVVFADPDTLAASWGNAAGGATIPEPASLSLLAAGGLAMLRRRSTQVLRCRR